MQDRPEGRSYVGATVRPSVLPHIHFLADLLGFRSSSEFFRTAIAHYAAEHRHELTTAEAKDSLRELATIAEGIPGRKATRLVADAERRQRGEA
jgi:hypothetical protein